MPKQLILIEARFLKVGDLVFDYKHRDLVKVEYVGFDRDTHRNIENVHVSYGIEALSADNFKPNAQVTILVDTDALEIILPENIGYR